MRTPTMPSLRLLGALLLLAGLPIPAQTPPSIVPNSIGPTMQGQSVSIPLTVPLAPNTCFNWSMLGTPPPGMTLANTSASLSATYQGTPTIPNVSPYNFQIFAASTACPGGPTPASFTLSQSYGHLIYPILDIAPLAAASGTVGVPYSQTFTQVGGLGSSSMSLVSGSVPPGLAFSFTASSAVLSGTPSTAGSYSFTLRSVDSLANVRTRDYAVVIAPFRIITPGVPNGVVGQFYSTVIQTAGGTPPITFGFDGTLPPGLSLNTSTGVLSGIPLAPGDFRFTVIAASGTLTTAPVSYAMSVVRPPLDFTPEVLSNAAVGRPYQAQFTPTGGNGKYLFSLPPGSTLPPGLSLSASGAVAGTPTSEGLFRFVVRLTSGEDNVEKLVRITIDPPALVIAPDSLAEGSRGVAYQATFTASGGTAPYVFSLASGQLPAGLSLTSAGVLSGTPTAAGSSKFTIQVIDARQRTGTREYELTVREPLRITTETLPSGIQGEAYSGLVEAAGGLAPYAFSLAAGALPPGVTLAADGRLSGTLTQAGAFTATIQAADRSNRTARRDYTITVGAALRLLPDSLPAGTAGVPYSASLTAEGGQAPYTFTITGTLPAGMSFANGVFSGTPTQAGQFSITGQVTDSGRRVATRQYTITIAAPPALIVSGTPGAGVVGAAYQAQFTASGGRTPYSFSGANLPPGLSLSSAGLLSGTPTASGTFNFTVRATDAINAQGTADFEMRVTLPATPPPTINISSPNPGPNQQIPVSITLASPYPVLINGFLELIFAPIRGGDDPAIQFSNGSRRINFAIPAGTTSGVFVPPQAAVQTGTVAGTITIQTMMQAGGSDITPSPRPTSTIRIAAGPPVITRVEVTRTATGSDLIVFCYSTAREITQGLLRLNPRSGVTLSQAEFTIPLSAVFTTWYASDQSVPFGSQARLVIPLTNVNTESVESLTIQLSNSAGSSETVRFTF